MTASIHSPASTPVHAKKPVNTGLSTETGDKPPETGGDFALLFANMMAGVQRQNSAATEGTPTPVATDLQAQPLGSNVNIITTTKPVMSDESLLAFAKSQGLDEKAISLIFQAKTASPAPESVVSPETANIVLPSPPPEIHTEASFDPTQLLNSLNLTQPVKDPALTAASAPSPVDANSQLLQKDAGLTATALPLLMPAVTPAAQANTPQSDTNLTATTLPLLVPAVKPAAQPNTLQLDADSSMSWSVENPEQTKALLSSPAPVANEALKPVLFGLNGVRDGVVKPTTIAATEQQTAHPENQSLAASLLFAAPEAAQFAKRLQSKMALLKAPEQTIANNKSAGVTLKPSSSEPSVVSLPDPVLDTLVIDTELTGKDLQSILAHKPETTGEKKDVSAPTPGNVSQTDAEERVQQYEKISQRVAEALGQRLSAQIARGDWKVDLTLKPHNLGNIGIELKMNKGELQASFTASSQATRDLIVDGLPKLKQTLGDLGMDIAHMDVNNKQDRQNGGNSTPGQQQQSGNRASPGGEIAKTVTTSTPAAPASNTGSADGLDVLV